jgi:hypothetical protein
MTRRAAQLLGWVRDSPAQGEGWPVLRCPCGQLRWAAQRCSACGELTPTRRLPALVYLTHPDGS